MLTSKYNEQGNIKFDMNINIKKLLATNYERLKLFFDLKLKNNYEYHELLIFTIVRSNLLSTKNIFTS